MILNIMNVSSKMVNISLPKWIFIRQSVFIESDSLSWMWIMSRYYISNPYFIFSIEILENDIWLLENDDLYSDRWYRTDGSRSQKFTASTKGFLHRKKQEYVSFFNQHKKKLFDITGESFLGTKIFTHIVRYQGFHPRSLMDAEGKVMLIHDIVEENEGTKRLFTLLLSCLNRRCIVVLAGNGTLIRKMLRVLYLPVWILET